MHFLLQKNSSKKHLKRVKSSDMNKKREFVNENLFLDNLDFAFIPSSYFSSNSNPISMNENISDCKVIYILFRF